MARPVVEVPIQDKPARAKLKRRKEPYWRMIRSGCHLGYFRGAKVGMWVARSANAPRGMGYTLLRLGEADDILSADGKMVLDWKAALERATAWFTARDAGVAAAAFAPVVRHTVRTVIETYVTMRDARHSAREGRPRKSDAHYSLRRNVLHAAKLAEIPLTELTEGHLRDWQRELSNRKASGQRRIISDLKAALNMAYLEHRRSLPADFMATVKFGLAPIANDDGPSEPAARSNQVLTDTEIQKIIRRALAMEEGEDVARMIIALAATGARFSQLRRMLVGDLQLEQSRLMIPTSRKGKTRTAGHIRVSVGGDVLEQLKPVLEDRKPGDVLLERWRHVQIGPAKWERASRGPWTSSSELSRAWGKIVDEVGLPGVIPYALRHSSIVRGIGAGLPIRLVAALHDTSVGMVERHYSRWITESLEDVAALAIVPLVTSK